MGAYEWNPTVGIDKYQYQPIKNDKPKLLQAAPNPFTWETTISAKWDFNGHVQIEVYSNSGLRIKILKSGRSGGKGSILTKWDGKDENGNILPTGIYHIVMFWDGEEVDGIKVVKKWSYQIFNYHCLLIQLHFFERETIVYIGNN